MRTDVYERITGQIVAELEQGVRPWLKPWNAEHAAGRTTLPLRHNGVPYQGINVVMLWAAAVAQGFAAPIWITFKQAQQLGAHVRKGEKGNLVVYASTVTRTETDEETGEEQERDIPFMKGYTVFNVEQIEGLPAHFYAPVEPRLDPVQRIDQAEAFFAATGAESYYATLGHECTHWTRHPSRLDRDFGRKRWGDEGYAMEELVAELGSAFLSADLDLTLEPREDHAAYIGSWLKVLKNDKRAVFAAAAHAQRAADLLHSLQARERREEAA